VIRLLVVDDSALMRRLLIEIFTAAGDFEIVATRGGAEALAMLDAVAPDVVTLDMQMPGMDGLACLDQIMIRRPCPVVILSGMTSAGSAETLEAMALGAVDFMPKPRGAVSLEIAALAPELVEKVRAAAGMRISRTLRLRERVQARTAGIFARQDAPVPGASGPGIAAGVVLIGCSTGGPSALDAVLGELPGDFAWPIVVAQHMPASFTAALAQRLDRMCALTVREVGATTPLLPGHAYIGRGNADLVLSRRGQAVVALSAPSSAAHLWHPSVDRLVESALRVVPAAALTGVLMTGMGADGAAAMRELHAQGGYTIAEAAETAAVWGMPGALVALGGATCVRPVDDIAATLLAHVGH
jgi:two-component system chemotaxis response regulator CheB